MPVSPLAPQPHADTDTAGFNQSCRISLGPEQRMALRRLSGRWLLAARNHHAYWSTREGRLIPPYLAVRRSLVESLLREGLLQAFQLGARRYYTISVAGRQALAGYEQKALPFHVGALPAMELGARATA
jgi:hypothetical protein